MAGFVLALLVLAGVSWLLLENGRKVTETGGWVTHTYEVMGKIEIVRSRLAEAESAQRGYLITGDESYLEPYRNALSTIDTNIGQIIKLTADNPPQQSRAVGLQATTTRNSPIFPILK